ncbi:MAG: GNAT family N-acetyltransferase [Gammaproteobacteria bacterium]
MSMIRPWHTSRQWLKFQLSDLTLARLPLALLACEIGAGAVDAGQAWQLPPSEPLAADLDGYLLRGWPIREPRPRIERSGGFLLYTPVQYQRHYVDLRMDFAGYRAHLGARTRGTIERKVRRFQKHCGGIDLRTYASPEQIAQFHPIAASLSAQTYQSRLLDSGLPGSEQYRDRLVQAAARDGVRGFILFAAGAPISFLLLTAIDGILVYEYLGYDPQWASWSPGTVLHWGALQSLFEERRFRLLDFTEGEGQQKSTLATGELRCATIYCLRAGARIQAAVRAHALMEDFSRGTGALLDRHDLRRPLKRLLRRFG